MPVNGRWTLQSRPARSYLSGTFRITSDHRVAARGDCASRPEEASQRGSGMQYTRDSKSTQRAPDAPRAAEQPPSVDLRGRAYEEQVALLTPVQQRRSAGAVRGAPVQMEGAANASPETVGQTAQEPPAITPYGYTALELKALVGDNSVLADRPDERGPTTQRWIAWGIQCNRRYAQDQVTRSNVAALSVASTFEAEVVDVFGEAGEAAKAAVTPVDDWLETYVDAFFSHALSTEQAALQADGAKGDDGKVRDDSEALTKTMLTRIGALKSAITTHFRGEGAHALKVLEVRQQLFSEFSRRADSVEDGATDAQKASGITGCNVVAQNALMDSFHSVDGAEIKETTEWKFDMEKRQDIKGGTKQQYNFYDPRGRSAGDVGAWTGKLSPKDETAVAAFLDKGGMAWGSTLVNPGSGQPLNYVLGGKRTVAIAAWVEDKVELKTGTGAAGEADVHRYLVERLGHDKLAVAGKTADEGLDYMSAVISGPRPKSGDIYVLANLQTGDAQHIGFFKYHEALAANPDLEIWHTFDGGQNKAEASGKVVDASKNDIKRVYNRKKNTLYMPSAETLTKLRESKGLVEDKGVKARGANADGDEHLLKGWVDVGKLVKKT